MYGAVLTGVISARATGRSFDPPTYTAWLSLVGGDTTVESELEGLGAADEGDAEKDEYDAEDDALLLATSAAMAAGSTEEEAGATVEAEGEGTLEYDDDAGTEESLEAAAS